MSRLWPVRGASLPFLPCNASIRYLVHRHRFIGIGSTGILPSGIASIRIGSTGILPSGIASIRIGLTGILLSASLWLPFHLHLFRCGLSRFRNPCDPTATPCGGSVKSIAASQVGSLEGQAVTLRAGNPESSVILSVRRGSEERAVDSHWSRPTGTGFV